MKTSVTFSFCNEGDIQKNKGKKKEVSGMKQVFNPSYVFLTQKMWKTMIFAWKPSIGASRSKSHGERGTQDLNVNIEARSYFLYFGIYQMVLRNDFCWKNAKKRK